MGIRRLIVVGATAVLFVSGFAAAHASSTAQRWDIDLPEGCRADGDTAYCVGVGQAKSGGSSGRSDETSAGVAVVNSGKRTAVDARQYDNDNYIGRFQGTGITASSESADAHAAVGQQMIDDPYFPPTRERNTGVSVGQGATSVWVGQHVDLLDNSCVLQVAIATLAPLEQPCPAGTEIAQIDTIPYTVPPGVEESCLPEPNHCPGT